ncbi:MAG: hypothetical protein IPL09_07560 [Bacteroidetes bacterium]|nr:hypothetical protein [Bacteroidota bacterium]
MMLHQKKTPPEEQEVEFETFYIPFATLSVQEVKNLSNQKNGKVFAAKRGGKLRLHPPAIKQDGDSMEADTSPDDEPIFLIKL